jgi:glycolate oxidase
MARTMRSGERYLMFGAYPASGASADRDLAQTLKESCGRALDAAEAYRLWGSRFFPVAPSHPTPAPSRVLVPASRIGTVLNHLRSGPAEPAVLGCVARDGSALLRAFAGSGAEGRHQSLSAGDEAGLVGIARSVGGDRYGAVLRQRAQPPPWQSP